MDELCAKNEWLIDRLRGLGSAAVAFSAGVDSTFLLKTAHMALGGDAAAVTVVTAAIPRREVLEARAFCEKEGIRLIEVPADVFSVEEFCLNGPDRCYYCKKELFGRIIKAAHENGFLHVLEGSNADDRGDYRPGMRAVRELGVLSPLDEAGLTKGEIRRLSRGLGLETADKPSFACLATRIAYGERITPEKLSMTELAEQRLYELGFRQYRVRLHGSLARIELPEDELEKMVRPEIRASVAEYLRSLGFDFVSLDLDGYRTGSMNRGVLREGADRG